MPWKKVPEPQPQCHLERTKNTPKLGIQRLLFLCQHKSLFRKSQEKKKKTNLRAVNSKGTGKFSYPAVDACSTVRRWKEWCVCQDSLGDAVVISTFNISVT